MYLFARACTRYCACTGTVFWRTYCACTIVQCFGMGKPGHVRILVFGLSRCTCSTTHTDTDSVSLGPHGQCTYLLVLVLVAVLVLIQCFGVRAYCAFTLVQCFGMGKPGHVRIFVFGLSRCTCSAAHTDRDSLLMMSHGGLRTLYVY